MKRQAVRTALLAECQPLRNLGNGQTSFVDIDRDFHVDFAQRLCLALPYWARAVPGPHTCSIAGRLAWATRSGPRPPARAVTCCCEIVRSTAIAFRNQLSQNESVLSK